MRIESKIRMMKRMGMICLKLKSREKEIRL